MRYALLLHYREATAADIGQETIEAGKAAFHAYIRDLTEAGVLISAEILQPSAMTTTISLRNGGLQVQDGPYAETKEQLAGAFFLQVPDLDAALAWAEKCPAAQWGAVEIRPSAIHVVDGSWVPA